MMASLREIHGLCDSEEKIPSSHGDDPEEL